VAPGTSGLLLRLPADSASSFQMLPMPQAWPVGSFPSKKMV
jgi:hypothetical protein